MRTRIKRRKPEALAHLWWRKTFQDSITARTRTRWGCEAPSNSELFFDDLEVPCENLIGREGDGFANLMRTLGMSRLFCASQAVGIAQGALTEAVAYAARARPVR